MTLGTTRSLNNRLIVEMYKKEALKSVEKNGFAFVSQKLTLKGLKILVDTVLSDGTFVQKGSTAFIKEETLHTQAWAQKGFECAGLDGQFLIVDLTYVEFISPITSSLRRENCSHLDVKNNICINCDAYVPGL
jgi:hypothetical protein